MENRIIGSYTQEINGPMVIAIGAIHGNEDAGLKAIQLMLKMLEVEPITNHKFRFRGTFMGVLGNVAAHEKGVRYIERDLNRMWDTDIINQVMSSDPNELQNEYAEMYMLQKAIKDAIEQYQPSQVVVIDLHTTSSSKGIFAIPNDKDPESVRIASHLKAPVVLEILSGIHGTTLNYFNQDYGDIDMTSVVFESGQHEDPLSVNRAIAALTNCLAIVDCVDYADVENQHNALLEAYSKDLPRITRVVDHFHIPDITKFKMLEGFENFQAISKGEALAEYDGKTLYSSHDARILMPLYQEKGEDGYFIVVEESI